MSYKEAARFAQRSFGVADFASVTEVVALHIYLKDALRACCDRQVELRS